VILEGAGDDLRGAGGEAVDQYDHRPLRRDRTAGLQLLSGGVQTRGGGHDARLEDAGDGHRLLEQAAAVEAQVEDEPLRPLAGQVLHILADLAPGETPELEEPHVTDLDPFAVDEAAVGLRDLDGPAHDLDLARLVRGLFGPHRERDARTLDALDAGDARLDRHPVRRLSVDFRDDVTGAEAGGLGRRSFEHRGDDEPFLGLLEGGADARVRATLLLLEVPHLPRREVHGVRVVQGVEHPVDARAGELAGVHGPVITALQLLDDPLLQLAGVARRGPLDGAEAYRVLAVHEPAGEVAAEEPDRDQEEDDDEAEDAHHA